jgi:hypothetical protein
MKGAFLGRNEKDLAEKDADFAALRSEEKEMGELNVEAKENIVEYSKLKGKHCTRKKD